MADRTRKGTRVEEEKKKKTRLMRTEMPSEKKMMMLHNQKKRRMMLQNPKKKKNKKENIVSVDYYNIAVIVDDDLVVSHILSRLPAKSLMRFKCVCKGWKSIIEQDSNFIKLYNTHSQARPVLLIATEEHWDSNCWQPACLCSVDLEYDSDGDNVIGANLRTTVTRFHTHTPDVIVQHLGPVRGLICLVNSSFEVQIYNVGTGQVITPWIESAVAVKRKYKGSPNRQFGFDPSTGKHKVVYVWDSVDYETTTCEVLTVGDTMWRIVDDVPPPCYDPSDTSVYANGSVYWIARTGSDLVAFDLGPEKFRMIRIPESTCNPPRYGVGFIEINGFPTVVSKNHAMFNMWRFHDHNKENGAEEEGHWSEVEVTLPSYIHVPYTYFDPIAGKDQIILQTYSGDDSFQMDVNRARFYSYNLTRKTLKEFKIRGISSVPCDFSTQFTTTVESLFDCS